MLVYLILKFPSTYEILVELIFLQDQITATIYKTWNSEENEKKRFEVWLFDQMLEENKGHSSEST